MAVESPSSPWTATILDRYISPLNKSDSCIDIPMKPTRYQYPFDKKIQTPSMIFTLEDLVAYSTLRASISLLSTAGYKTVKPAMFDNERISVN